MSPTPRRLAAFTCLLFAGLWIFILTGPRAEVRVESKSDTVRVLPRTGMWFHEYRVTMLRALDSASASPNASAAVAAHDRGSGTEPDGEDDTDVAAAPIANPAQFERITLRVTEAQYDGLRTGERLTLQRLPLLSWFAWQREESVMLGFLHALGARTVRYQNPRSIAPTLGSSSGLARVLSVHRIAPKRGLLELAGAGSANQALDIVVVEFWAPRLRTVVRTADVVNARSINDLGPGQVLQMHFDPRMPRVMRLDDGMRSTPP